MFNQKPGPMGWGFEMEHVHRSKTMLNLDLIYKHNPRVHCWNAALAHLEKTKPDTEPLPFATILKAVELDGALWCLRCLPERYDGDLRLLACDFAESVLHMVPPGEDRPRLALKAVRGFVAGSVTEAEMKKSARAAWSTWETAAALIAGHVVARDAEGLAEMAAGWAHVAAARAADHAVRAAVAAAGAALAAREARAAGAAASGSLSAGMAAEREKQTAMLLDWTKRRGV